MKTALSLVEAAREHTGRVDVLVNNAGTTGPTQAADEDAEGFRSVLDVNVVAAFRLAVLAAGAADRPESMSVINVASILGLVGTGQIPFPSYAASKGAVVALTRELAAQWSRRGVRVNAIAPGWFESEMTAEMFAEELLS